MRGAGVAPSHPGVSAGFVCSEPRRRCRVALRGSVGRRVRRLSEPSRLRGQKGALPASRHAGVRAACWTTAELVHRVHRAPWLQPLDRTRLATCELQTPGPLPSTPFTAAHVAPLGITEKRLRSARRLGQDHPAAPRGLRCGAMPSRRIPCSCTSCGRWPSRWPHLGRVASHETAALALGLPLFDTDRVAAGPVHLTRPASASDRSRTSSDRRIHLGSLPGHHVVTLPSGLVVTTPARTALDVAAGVPLPMGLMVADAAARLAFADLAGSLDRRHYDNARLRTAALVPLMEAVAHVRVPGAASRLHGPPGPGGRPPGVPARVVQRRAHAPGWPAHAAAPGSCPNERPAPTPSTSGGRSTGSSGRPTARASTATQTEFVREKEREGHLRDAGNDVVRWTGRETFRTPHVVMERIMRALVAGGWTP